MIQTDNHAFKGLDAALKHLCAQIGEMEHSIAAISELAIRALDAPNADLFAQAKQIDKRINQAEAAVDVTVAGMINKFTMIGEDLRFTLGSIKCAGTLERAGDKLKNCVKRLTRLTSAPETLMKKELRQAMEAVQHLFPLTMAQWFDYQPEKAAMVLAHGTKVQQAYRHIVLLLQQGQCVSEDVPHLLLIAKNLDQVSDMAVEIMKIAHYVHTGVKYDKRSADA